MAVYFQAQREAARTQQKLQDQVAKSVPAFVEAARLYLERKNLDKALEQLDVALLANRNHEEALLLKGQVLIVRKEFAAAKTEVDKYLKQRPNDADAGKLVELCVDADPKNPGLFLAFAEIFHRQKQPSLAEQSTLLAGDSLEVRKKLLLVYQRKIEAAWPGLGKAISVNQNGDFVGNFYQAGIVSLEPLRGIPFKDLGFGLCRNVHDLEPLRGMPLTKLSIQGCGKVRNLAPLSDSPLTGLSFYGTGVEDVTPLERMNLHEIQLPGEPRKLRGLEVLRKMKNLRTIDFGAPLGKFSADHFWKRWDAGEFK